jgi:hypothetical protein
MRTEPIANEPLPRPQSLSRLHGLATAGMAICALVGILAMLGFITVRWPGDSARFIVGLLVTAIVGFLLCCSIAVFSAARDTYSRRGTSRHSTSVGNEEE